MTKRKWNSAAERCKFNSEKWREENPERERIRRKNQSLMKTATKHCGMGTKYLRDNKMNGICDICGAKLRWDRDNNREWVKHVRMTHYGKICSRCCAHLDYFDCNPDILMRVAYYLRVSMNIMRPIPRDFPKDPDRPPCVMRYFKTMEYADFVRENTENEYDIPTAASLRREAKRKAEEEEAKGDEGTEGGEVSEIQTSAEGMADKERPAHNNPEPLVRIEKEMGASLEDIEEEIARLERIARMSDMRCS